MDNPKTSESSFNPEIRLDTLESPIHWAGLFENSRPVEVEIGFGKGRFLITAAERFPDVNYFGIERKLSYFGVARQRVAKRELQNVRIVRMDAIAFVKERIADASVRAFHVYFPDPWWKKRHKKRRIFTLDWVEDLARALVPGGYLYTASDVGEYFEHIQDVIGECPKFRALDNPAERMEAAGYVPSNFEVKMARAGHPIHRAVYERV